MTHLKTKKLVNLNDLQVF